MRLYAVQSCEAGYSNNAHVNIKPVLHSTLILFDVKENGSDNQSQEQGHSNLQGTKTVQSAEIYYYL